jgi:2-methylisocitrate lyase-like PEP mutase family enzyme
LIAHYREMVDATGLPTICDIDDGGASPLKIARNVALVEQAGIAGFHIEDTDLTRGKYLPCRAKQLFTIERMTDHIKAALDARRDSQTIVIARTDARDGFSLSEAVDRVGTYSLAGADMVLIPFLEIDEIPHIKAAISCHLAHMFIPSDAKDAADVARVEKLGVKYLMYPVLSVWAAAKSMQEALVALLETKCDVTKPHGAVTWKMVNDAVRSDHWSRVAR